MRDLTLADPAETDARDTANGFVDEPWNTYRMLILLRGHY